MGKKGNSCSLFHAPHYFVPQCTLSAGRHIVVDALYGKQTRFLSHGGDVAVGDAHGDLEVVASKQSIYLGELLGLWHLAWRKIYHSIATFYFLPQDRMTEPN